MSKDISSTVDLNQKEKSSDRKEINSTIIRVHHNIDHPYVMISKKSLWDTQLSLEATGLLARLLSRPSDWQIRITELIKSSKCGKNKIYRMLNELIEAGYCFRYQSMDNPERKGQFNQIEYIIFEEAKSKEEIQKMFTLPCFTRTLNDPLLNNKKNTKYIRDKRYAPISKEEIDAKNSPFSKEKSKPSTIQTSELKLRAPLVYLSDAQHSKLIAKYGEALTLQAYEYLSEWKESKSESEDRKSLGKHTDYYRITKWVIKALKEESSKKSSFPSKENQISEEEIYENKQFAKGLGEQNWKKIVSLEVYVSVNADHIRIGNDTLYFKDKKFKELLKHYFVKYRIISP